MKATELTEEDGKVILENVSCEVGKFTRARGIECFTDELTGEGVLKVCQNLEQFDPAKGKLSTFAQAVTQNMLTDKGRIATGRANNQETVYEQGWASGCRNEAERQIRMRTFLLVTNEMSDLSRNLFELHMCMKRKDGSWRGVHEIINLVREAASLEPMAWSTFRDGMLKKCREEFIRAWRKSFCEKIYIWESDL